MRVILGTLVIAILNAVRGISWRWIMAGQIIQCERCQRKYQVPQHLAGKAFQCRNCDHVVLIPDLATPTYVDEDHHPEVPAAPVRRASRRVSDPEHTVRSNQPRRRTTDRHLKNAEGHRGKGGIWHIIVGAGSAVVSVLAILGIQSLWRGSEQLEVASGQVVTLQNTSPEANGSVTPNVVSENSLAAQGNASTDAPATSGSAKQTPSQDPSSTSGSEMSPSFVGTPAIVAPAAFAPPVTSPDRNDSESRSSLPQPVGAVVADGSGTQPRSESSLSGSAVTKNPNATTAASSKKGEPASDKPGRYGKSKYSIQIPDGFVLEDVMDEPDEFHAQWRTIDSSIDKMGSLEFNLRFNPALVAGSRPPLYAEGGVFIGGGEMYIATGGKLETLTLGGITFYKLTYPKEAGEKRNKWIMMAHFDGARVMFEGKSSAPEPDKLLGEIVATFSSSNTQFVTPSRRSGVGFDEPEMASAPGFSPDVAQPESSGSGAGGSNTNDVASATANDWGGSGGGKIIRLKRPPGVAAPPAFSGMPPRFILNGSEVINAVTGDLVVELPAELEDGGSAISSDGKRVAHYPDTFGHKVSVIQIYSCESPETPPVRIENPEGTWWIGAMKFLDANRLIVHIQSEGWIVWDSTTGKKLTTIEGDAPSDAGLTFSTDGRYMAVADHRTVLVYDTARGRVAARMARNHKGRDLDLFSCSGLAFSPDMQELAGLFSGGQFVVWSNKGEVILEEVLSDIEGSMGRDMSAVFYLPDKSGWFLNGNKLLDRKSMTFLWEINRVAWHDGVSAVLDQNTVMTASNDGGDLDLVFLTIPWEKIRAAQGEMTPDARPLLTRGGAVSLEVQMGEVRFADAGQTQASVIDGLKQRLALSEVSVADNQPVKLVVNYSEATGGQKTVRSMFGRLGGGAAETVVEDTTITVNIEMRVEGRTEPIWKREIKEEIDLIVDAELNPQAFRNNNFTRAMESIKRLNFPTRINNGGDSALPVQTSL